MRICTSLIILFSLFAAHSAISAPNSLTYQGRILKSDGTPLEYNNVSFLFEVTNPAGTCVIYREQKNAVNMSNSGGVFDVPIGTGTKLFPSSPTKTLLSVFDNTANLDCGDASNNIASTYTPAQGHSRILRVQFHDGTGWKLISPDSEIRTVPFSAFAQSAQTLGTKTADDFVLKTGLPTCGAGTFLSYDGTNLSCAAVAGASGGTVTTVTSSNAYLTIVNNTSTPALTLNVGTAANTVAAGNDSRFSDSRIPTGSASGDLSGTYPNPSVAKLQGVSVSAVAPTNGHFLKYNGTNWLSSAIGITDVSGLSASLSSYLTQSAFNSAVSTGTCLAHETMYWNSVSSNFQCRAINVSLAGDVSGAIGATSVDKIKGIGIDFSTAPTSGQFLKYNGSSFISSSLTTSDMPAFTGDATSSAGSTTLTLANSGVTAGTYKSVTVDIKGRVTAGTNPTTLSGFGITDAVKNAGNAVSIQSGIDASKGAASTNGRFYFATDTQKIYFDNGSSWIQVASNAGTGGTVTNVATGTGLSGGPITATGTISLANTTVTAASYGSATQVPTFTVDAQGRLTAANNTSIAIPWSAITSGVPTTLAGYGITDSVKNLGGSPGLQTGTDASKPGSPSAGTIYFATDSLKIYQYNSGAWVMIASATGSGGTVTSVTSANADIAVATTTSTPILTLNSGTGANQIVKLDGSAKLPAIDGSALTNLNASSLTSGTVSTAVLPTIPLTKGGTGLTSAGTANQVLGMNNAGTAAEFKTITAGSGVSVTHGANSVTIATTGAPPTGTAGGDLSGTYPNPTINTVTVAKGGTGLTTGTSGGIPYFNSATTMASSAALTVNGVLLGGGTGTSPTATSAGAAYQPLRVPAGGGAPAFGAIDISQSAAVTGILPITNGGTGASSLAANRLIGTNGTGTVQQAVTCAINQILSFDASGNYGCYAISSIYSGFINGGNSFGAASNLGNNDNYDLNIKTNNLTRMTIQAGGNVGIGVSSPGAALDIQTTQTATSGNLIGSRSNPIVNPSAASSASSWGLWSTVTSAGANNITGAFRGVEAQSTHAGSGTLTTAYGVNGDVFNSGSGIITTAAGVYSYITNSGTGSVTNGYGVYTGTIQATNKWSIYASDSTAPSYFAGNVGIGTTPSQKLSVAGVIESTSGGIKFPDGTTQTTASAINGAQYDSGWTQSATNTTFTFAHGLGVTPLYVTVLAKDNASGKIINVSSQYAYGYTNYGGLVTVTFDSTNIKLVTFTDPNIGQFVNGAGSAVVLAHANASIRVLAWTTGGPLPSYWSQSGSSIYYNGGNIGIGTTSPVANLHIAGTGTGNSAYSTLQMGNDATVANNFHWVNEYNAGRSLRLYSGNLGSGSAIMSINQTGLVVGEAGSNGAGVLSLKPGVADHVYLQLFARTATPSTRSGYIGYPAASATNLTFANEISNGVIIFKTNNAGTNQDSVTISANGNMTIAGTNYYTSDRRMKKDITPLSGNLQNILQLNPVSYHWIDSKKDATLQTGFVAQEIETIYPHVVQTNDKGFKSVSYTSLIAPLAGAIQEMYAKFTSFFADHEARLTALETQMNALKQQNELLRQQNEQLVKVLKSQNEKAQRIPASADK